jgi:hypothetical protein
MVQRKAKLFTIPKGALERNLKDNIKPPGAIVRVNLEWRPIIPNHTESKLVQYCMEIDERY